MAKLAVYSLGTTGVILDPNPLEPTLPPNSLVGCQNMIHDPKSGHGGGLRNRDGLAKFNTVSAGGAILGGTPMVAANTGGAPAPASPTTPGGTPGSPAEPGTPGTPTDPDNPTSPLFPPVAGGRTVIIGEYYNPTAMTVQADVGWIVTAPALAVAPVISVLTDSPGAAHRSVPVSGFWAAAPGFAIVDGYMYYPGWQSWAAPVGTGIGGASGTIVGGHNLNIGVVQPTIRRMNGVVDELVCSVPKNTTIQDNYFDPGTGAFNDNYGYGPNFHVVGSQRGGDFQPTVVSIVSANGNTLFFSVIDRGALPNDEADHSTPGDDVARIMRYTLTDHHLVEVPLRFTGDGQFNVLPYALAWWNDRLWYGGYSAGIPTPAALIYYISPNDGTEPVLRSTVAAAMRPTVMVPFDGYLFVGFQTRDTTRAPLYRYSADTTTDPTIQLIDDGASPATDNGFVAMVEFNGELYASYVNPFATSLIVKYSRSLGTWTSVFASVTDYMLYLAVDNGILYAYGQTFHGTGHKVYSSTDGVTFTDRTALLLAALPFSGLNNMLPILFGFDS